MVSSLKENKKQWDGKMWQVCVMCVCVCYACVCVCVYTCVHARACGPLSRGLNDAKWKP